MLPCNPVTAVWKAGFCFLLKWQELKLQFIVCKNSCGGCFASAPLVQQVRLKERSGVSLMAAPILQITCCPSILMWWTWNALWRQLGSIPMFVGRNIKTVLCQIRDAQKHIKLHLLTHLKDCTSCCVQHKQCSCQQRMCKKTYKYLRLDERKKTTNTEQKLKVRWHPGEPAVLFHSLKIQGQQSQENEECWNDFKKNSHIETTGHHPGLLNTTLKWKSQSSPLLLQELSECPRPWFEISG